MKDFLDKLFKEKLDFNLRGNASEKSAHFSALSDESKFSVSSLNLGCLLCNKEGDGCGFRSVANIDANV